MVKKEPCPSSPVSKFPFGSLRCSSVFGGGTNSPFCHWIKRAQTCPRRRSYVDSQKRFPLLANLDKVDSGQGSFFTKTVFIVLFALLALDGYAGYLGSRNWGERVEVVGARDGVLGSSLLEEYPVFWPKDQKVEITEVVGFGSLFQEEFRSKEPLQRGNSTRLRAPFWPSARLKLVQPYPVYLCLGYSGSVLFNWKGERALFDKGNPDGAILLKDRGEIPWFRFGLTVPWKERFFVGLNYNFARGDRRMDFKKWDKDQNLIYEFSETTSFGGSAWGARLFGFITEGWGIGLAFEGKAALSGYNSNLIYQSTATAGSSSPNVGRVWSLPDSWRVMLVKKDARSRIFVGEIQWIQFSKMKVDGKAVDSGGAGFFIDDANFQGRALGKSAASFPSYHDAVGVKLGFENPLNQNFTLRLGSKFWTHYAEPRLITPTLSLGLGVKASRRLDVDFGFSFMNRDYFGDDLLWPKDERIKETEINLVTSFRVKI